MSSTNSESDSLFGDDPVGGDLFGDEFGGGDELAITNVGSEDPKVTSLTFPTLSVAVPFGGLSLPLSLPVGCQLLTIFIATTYIVSDPASTTTTPGHAGDDSGHAGPDPNGNGLNPGGTI